MTSSLKYILYLSILHLALGVLAYYLFQENKALVLVAEIILLLSAYVAWRIYRSIISPVRLLGRGAAALEDQDFSVKLMPTGSREMDGLVNVYNSMIDQLREERVSARQREEFLDRLIEAAELGVVVLDFDGKVASMNTWMLRKSKEDAFRTTVLDPALHLRTRPETQDVFVGPDNRRYHVEHATFVDQGFERGFLVIQDVTSELLAAEKEAYGKVIRMMAHEVNNSNAAIVSLLRTLLEAAGETPEESAGLSQDYLPVVINRAENMTTFMRNFARVVRLPPAEKKRIDLNELLHRTGEVMGSVLDEADIELGFELHPGAVWLEADAAHLEQVVVNALTNARQSIGSDGQITISSGAFPASFVIADDGPGIPPEVESRLFTPFFSTKPTGQGVGLTLTRDILEAHGATYSLRTEADDWTRLRVSFGQD
ncbi:MAG: ATP-binding protein [Bacteroidota bacterium]